MDNLEHNLDFVASRALYLPGSYNLKFEYR